MAAYILADVNITDAAGFEAYRQQVPATVAKYGGKFCVRGGKIETLEGTWDRAAPPRRSADAPPRPAPGQAPSGSIGAGTGSGPPGGSSANGARASMNALRRCVTSAASSGVSESSRA